MIGGLGAGSAAHQNWRIGLLRRLRPRPALLELNVFAGKARFLFGPQLAHQQHVLAQNLAALLEVKLVVAHLFHAPAVADAELEATAGNHVETGDLFGKPNWVALRDQGDAGAEA